MTKIYTVIAFLMASCLFSAQSFAADACPLDYKPVCGQIGDQRMTYGNKCQAEQAGAKILHEGECEAATKCMEIVMPVCAIDPKTNKETDYSNRCFAEVAGAKFVHTGKCKAAK